MFMGRRIISEHLTLVIKKKPRNATERQHVQITHEMSFEKKYGIALIWFCLTYALREPMDYHPFIIQQRGRGKIKDLISRKIAQHVRFKTFYISQMSYAKQQCEITTICVVCEPKPRWQIILISILNSTLLFIHYEIEVWRRMRR